MDPMTLLATANWTQNRLGVQAGQSDSWFSEFETKREQLQADSNEHLNRKDTCFP